MSHCQPVAWMVYTQDGQSCYVTDNPADVSPHQRALPLYTEPFPTDESPLRAKVEALQSENKRLWAEVSELRAARIAYANEFPATKDGDPDTGNIHSNIRALKVRADKLEKTLRAYQKAVNRIDDLIEYALPMPRETKGALHSVLADLTEELVKENKA